MTQGPKSASGAASWETADRLIGREREVELLGDRLTALSTRGGGSVLLSGAPGIGKTALAGEFALSARRGGALLLRTDGHQAESGLPFAGLLQLTGEVLADLSSVPVQRRRALLAAFGLAEPASGRPEPFLIGLAVLDLLGTLAADRPVVLMVEDAHWLDRETAELLAFVSRRLTAERVLLMATARPGYRNALIDAIEDVLEVQPLTGEAAAALLDRSAPGAPPGMRSRVLRLAAGNPLALLELPRAQEDVFAVVEPITDRLLRAFTTRSLSLAGPVRTALLIAALDDQAGLAEILSAASSAGGSAVAVTDLEPAQAAGLVRAEGGRLTFRHALVRAAIYNEADGEQRRRARLALAGVLTGEPERAAWLRAAASPAPDAELAGELERIADSARRRGGLSTALAAQKHAIALSGGADRVRRLLDGAELAFHAGDRALLETMVAEVAAAGDLSPAEQARLEYLGEAFTFRPWTAETIRAAVGRARAASAAGHPRAALDLLGSVVARSYMSGADEEVLRHVTAALDELELPPEEPGALRVYAYAAPVERGEVLLKQLHEAVAAATGDGEALYDVAMAAGPLGDSHLQVAAMVPAIEDLRRRGRVTMVVPALWALAQGQYFTGDWSGGAVAAAESTRFAVDTVQPQWAAAARLTEATFAAARGEVRRAQALIDETLAETPLFAASQVARAAGSIALADERYHEAYASFARVFVREDPAYHSAIRVWVAVDLAEAAAAADRRTEALVLLRDLTARLDRTPSPLLRTSMTTALALLASDDEAGERFARAVAPQAGRWPFIWARAQLAFGVWLRRQRRVSESRIHLRTARDQFDQLGAAPWGERARRELRAAGERSPAAVASPAGGLTAQELQIATLAAQGLTNREIGERLFLSHRTVGTYLYQTFPKLGVSSRQQLASVLPPVGPRERK